MNTKGDGHHQLVATLRAHFPATLDILERRPVGTSIKRVPEGFAAPCKNSAQSSRQTRNPPLRDAGQAVPRSCCANSHVLVAFVKELPNG